MATTDSEIKIPGRYQVLFRFLFSLRHLEQQLVANWQALNKAPGWAHKSSDKQIELCKRRAFTMQARMLVYVQQLLYFSTAEVIEPNWQGFMEKLKVGSASAVGTVDELMQNHVDFLDTCLKECMLTNARLLRVISLPAAGVYPQQHFDEFLTDIAEQRHSKLMQTCTLFSGFIQWFSRDLVSHDPDLSGSTKPSCMNHQHWSLVQKERKQSSIKASGITAPQLEKLLSNLKKFEISFGRHMYLLIDELNHFAATETVVLLGLCARLSDVHQGGDWRGSGSKTGDGLDT